MSIDEFDILVGVLGGGGALAVANLYTRIADLIGKKSRSRLARLRQWRISAELRPELCRYH